MSINQTLIEKYRLQKYLNMPNIQKSVESLDQLLTEEVFGIEMEAKEIAVRDALKQVFSRLDPSFLSTRHTFEYCATFHDDLGYKLSLPRFAVHSLDSPNLQLEIEVKGHNHYGTTTMDHPYLHSVELLLEDVKIKPELPEKLRVPLTTAISLIWKNDGEHTVNSRTYTFQSLFCGFIPKDIKEKIKMARKAFGKDLYLVAEADWKLIEEVTPVPTRDPRDPLVIGVKREEVFLISEFNCTPLEDYFKKEFRLT